MATNTKLSTTTVLERIRTKIASTEDWQALHHSLELEVEKNCKDRDTSSKQVDLQRSSVGSIKESKEYKRVKDALRKELHSQLSKAKTSDQRHDLLSMYDLVSGDIVDRRPELRAQLIRQCINHPLPLRLRQAAWHAVLSDEQEKQEFLMRYKGQNPVDFLKSWPALADKCKSILNSNPVFAELQTAEVLLVTFCYILDYWRHKCSEHDVSDSEILLLIPFVYITRRDLLRPPLNWPRLATIAEMYVCFMETLPLVMRTMCEVSQSVDRLSVLVS